MEDENGVEKSALDIYYINRAGGNFKATVVLNKNETMIQMMYKITGSVELTCDRSLDLFDHRFRRHLTEGPRRRRISTRVAVRRERAQVAAVRRQ